MSGEKQGGSKGGLQCRVKLLDGSEFQLDIDKKELGQFVFDQILRRLGLTDKDKDYFGLEYEDEQKLPQWLDLQKPVKKQLKKSPFTLMFKVKYYPLDPVPHTGCRTHFYRQIRRDLIASKMRCPVHSIPDVISCILQADMGDFESMDQDIEFMTDQGLIIDPTLESAAVQDEVVKLHRLHRGKTPQDAVKAFLRKVRELDSYGVRLFDVKHDDSACQLGLSPQGVSLFRRNRRMFIYDWMTVSQISFKTKKFILMVEKEIGGDLQLVFELDSMKLSKELWSVSRNYAEFYTDPRRRVQEEPEPQTQNLRSPGAQGTTAATAGADDHFTFPPPQQPTNVNQADANKVKSLPRFLPTSGDPVAAALRLNRRPKSASPERVPDQSNLIGDHQASSLVDKPSAPQDVHHRSHDLQQQSHDQRQHFPEQSRDQRQWSHDQQQQPHDQRQQFLEQSRDQRQWSHDQQQQAHDQRQQFPDQSHDQRQLPHVQQQQSHDHQQWSHDQPEVNAGHYDSLNCRDEYLAQLHSQQRPPEEPYAVPRPARTSDPVNPGSASRSHSTINPDELSQDQDVDGSLLDLADELGEDEEEKKESPRTGQSRAMAGVPAALQTSDSNVGRSPISPGRAANQRAGYNSYTLPHSFASGDKSPRRWTGGSPRRRTGGSSDEDSGPPKPPRTDFPHHPTQNMNEQNGRMMSGNSPYLPGSSYTTGRQHDKKRNLVRTWVQDQQLRAYHSSSSQESSVHGSPSAHLRRQQQSTPDTRAMQNGQGSGSPAGRLPGESPSNMRSRHHSLGSSPSHMRSHATEGQSHDLQKHLLPTATNGQQVQPVKPVSPKQARRGIPPSPTASGHQDNASSESSPGQSHGRPSETVAHLQSDPQVPALIKEIDDLMGGLLDSPTPEPKQTHEDTSRLTDGRAEPETWRAAANVDPDRPREREVVVEKEEVDNDDIVFPKNFNPADFIRDEDIKIDPRNFLNTPSPEPNLLELKGAISASSSAGHSPLVGGVLSTKLQAAMDEEADYHDPPPPPPHLMALTHGMRGAPAGRNLPGGQVKKKPPDVSPKPRLGGAVKVESKDQTRRSGKQPAASQYTPSNLPPEIASFVTRVRNRSLDGGDSSISLGGGAGGGVSDPQHGRQASAEISRPSKEAPKDRPSSAVEKIQRSPVRVSPTYDIPRSSVSPTFDPLTVKVTASNAGQGPASVERVTITPEATEMVEERSTNLSTPNQNGRPSSSEMSPSTGSYPSAAAVYPEAYNPPNAPKEQVVSNKTDRSRDVGGLVNGDQPPGQDAGPGQGMYSYDYYKQQLAGQNPQQAVAASSWETERTKREIPPQQQQQQAVQPPPQQYQLRSQPSHNMAAAKNTSMNAQRGQGMRYGASPRHESYGSSDGSNPTTPHAHSDMALAQAQPRSPTGVAPDSLGYRYPPSYGNRQPNPHSRNYYPNQQQAGYYPPPQDIRRTQTFSMGQGGNRPVRAPPYHRHPGGEDSLPNSPTYLAQNPPQLHDRQMMSPNTSANYRSFQEHLEKLNTTQHGRKMRVLDWMQNQQQQQQQPQEYRQMIRDPQTEIPSRPYQKQTHIYASAAELEPPPAHVPNPSEQMRPWSAQGQGGYPSQERGRVNTYTYGQPGGGARAPMQRPGPAWSNSQVDRGRSYVNVPPHAGNSGRVGGMPASAQNLPTAKFEKDYYILDV